jgi:hypothetical protein
MKRTLALFLIVIAPLLSWAQEDDEDLLSLLEDEETIDYTSASFKASRVINLHSVETTSKGVLDVKISHRLGAISGGIDEFYGLDQAQIRLGAEYGFTDWLTAGFGRSSFEKTYDGFIKAKLLRQSAGARKMPVSIVGLATMAVKTIAFPEPDRENYFSSRLSYAYQLIICRKFTEGFSLQLSPTMVHRNLVRTADEANDVFALAVGGRAKLTARLSVNFEYIYVVPDQLADEFTNSASIGFDIETGGHVFQLHFTNSTSIVENGFIAETRDEWKDGDVHFGFNVSRVFTIGSGKH